MPAALSTTQWRDQRIVPANYESIAALVKLARKARGQAVEFDWAFGRDDGDGEGLGGEGDAEPDAAPILSDVTGVGSNHKRHGVNPACPRPRALPKVEQQGTRRRTPERNSGRAVPDCSLSQSAHYTPLNLVLPCYAEAVSLHRASYADGRVLVRHSMASLT